MRETFTKLTFSKVHSHSQEEAFHVLRQKERYFSHGSYKSNEILTHFKQCKLSPLLASLPLQTNAEGSSVLALTNV